MRYTLFCRPVNYWPVTGATLTGWLICCLLLISPGCNRQPVADSEPTAGDARDEAGTATDPAAVSATAPPVNFSDVTATTGITSIYRNGEEGLQRSIVESLGGGLGMFDFDLDGQLDLFFPGGGQLLPNQPLPGIAATLWRNQGGLKFSQVTQAAGTTAARHYTHGCAMADYDSDGFDDILVTGYGGLTLFRNQGDGTFVECALSSGLTSQKWSSSAAWADLDGDGHLDIFITNYVDWSWEKNPQCFTSGEQREICSPQDFAPQADLVYFNSADGTFRPADTEIGIRDAGKGLGVVAVDVNLDGAIDVYVANDTTNNLLFMNDGQGNLKEAGVISGTAYDQRGVSNGSMGLAVLDYDNNLQPDLWVTNYENETFALYHNDAEGMFRCLTERTGITALGSLYVGFGTVAADFTRQGHEDIVVSNGHVMLYPIYSEIAQVPLYLRNDGRGRISRVLLPQDSYFSGGHRGRGVVTGDLDGDGKLDLAFSHVNEPAVILKQTTELAGNWLAIDLVGVQQNRNAIGAHAILETSGRKLFRTVVGGGSYLSQSPYTMWFGFPAGETIERLTLVWPGGQTQQIASPPINSRQTLIEPREQTGPNQAADSN